MKELIIGIVCELEFVLLVEFMEDMNTAFAKSDDFLEI